MKCDHGMRIAIGTVAKCGKNARETIDGVPLCGTHARKVRKWNEPLPKACKHGYRNECVLCIKEERDRYREALQEIAEGTGDPDGPSDTAIARAALQASEGDKP
jgi:hypothetical protein